MNFLLADLKKFSLGNFIIVKSKSYASKSYTIIPGEL